MTRDTYVQYFEDLQSMSTTPQTAVHLYSLARAMKMESEAGPLSGIASVNSQSIAISFRHESTVDKPREAQLPPK